MAWLQLRLQPAEEESFFFPHDSIMSDTEDN